MVLTWFTIWLSINIFYIINHSQSLTIPHPLERILFDPYIKRGDLLRREMLRFWHNTIIAKFELFLHGESALKAWNKQKSNLLQGHSLKYNKIFFQRGNHLESFNFSKVVFENTKNVFFYILIMDEKVLVLCEKWLSNFSSNLYVLRPPESEKRVFTKVSVCLSVCRSCAA